MSNKKIKKNYESFLQIQIVNYLRELQKKYLFRFFHCPNEGKRKIQYMKKLKAMGMRSGVPDLILEFPNSKFIYCEIKTKTGQLSKSQKLWRVQSEILGTPFFLLKGDYNDCKKVIDNIFGEYEYARIK